MRTLVRKSNHNRHISRRATAVLLLIVLLAPARLLSSEVTSVQSNPATDTTIVVSGIGYPPIRAESPAQARLMARRAAVVDTYRNALAAGAGSPDTDELSFYSGLSGFVKGLTIEREEYLEDGGVRITARVPAKGAVPPVPPRAVREGTSERGRGGPSPVPLNEWYRIIEQSVRYE